MNDKNRTLKGLSVTERLISLILEMSEEQQKTLLKELEERLPKEKRRHPRKPVSTFVDFVVEGRGYREFTRDISEAGVFIETAMPFSVGTKAVITFSGFSRPLKATGRIARVEEGGIGVQFDAGDMLETLSIDLL